MCQFEYAFTDLFISKVKCILVACTGILFSVECGMRFVAEYLIFLQKE